MSKRSVTIKAAWIGGLCAIAAAIIGGLFVLFSDKKPVEISPENSQNTIVIIDSTVEGDFVVKEVPVDEIPVEKKPKGFDLNDPKIIDVKAYDLRKDKEHLMVIGPCPAPPCFKVRYVDLEYDKKWDGYWVNFHLWGGWPGTQIPETGVNISIALIKGCGNTLYFPGYKLAIEIIDDRITSLRAMAAAWKESRPDVKEGWVLGADYAGCR